MELAPGMDMERRRGTSLVLEVEIPLPPRRSSRTPVRTSSHVGQRPLRGVRSPLRETSRAGRTPTETPTKTPSKTPSKLVHDLSSNPITDTPQSSVLSSLSPRDGSRTPRQAPHLPVSTEEFNRLAILVRDVPVTFSDGQQTTPTKGSASQPRILGRAERMQTPSAKRIHDFSTHSRGTMPSSLPPNPPRDVLKVMSPSQRASMDRPWRPHAKSAMALRHQDLFVNVAEKRKVPGTPIIEEAKPDSPSKRRHLSPEEPKAPVVRARRAKPVFANASPVRTQVVTPMTISPARSIRTDCGSAPNTPFRPGASLFLETATTASPVQEYDRDRSYVSSSVMEEKMPLLIPYERAIVEEKMQVETATVDIGMDAVVEDVETTVELNEDADVSDLLLG